MDPVLKLSDSRMQMTNCKFHSEKAIVHLVSQENKGCNYLVTLEALRASLTRHNLFKVLVELEQQTSGEILIRCGMWNNKIPLSQRIFSASKFELEIY